MSILHARKTKRKNEAYHSRRSSHPKAESRRRNKEGTTSQPGNNWCKANKSMAQLLQCKWTTLSHQE